MVIIIESEESIPTDKDALIEALTKQVGSLNDEKKSIDERLKMCKSELEMITGQYRIASIATEDYFVKVIWSLRFSKWDSNKKVYRMIPDDMKATLVIPDRKKILAEIDSGNLSNEILEHQVFKEITTMRFKSLRR